MEDNKEIEYNFQLFSSVETRERYSEEEIDDGLLEFAQSIPLEREILAGPVEPPLPSLNQPKLQNENIDFTNLSTENVKYLLLVAKMEPKEIYSAVRNNFPPGIDLETELNRLTSVVRRVKQKDEEFIFKNFFSDLAANKPCMKADLDNIEKFCRWPEEEGKNMFANILSKHLKKQEVKELLDDVDITVQKIEANAKEKPQGARHSSNTRARQSLRNKVHKLLFQKYKNIK
eukprot:augustus_masked-scaffold_24-processed-gene-2.9-mRNA-1 protein AED:1.00 eAED:1.00 QI:0/-1/0/0/-1/1/1/0/230